MDSVELGKRNKPEVKQLMPAQSSIKSWQQSGKLTIGVIGKKQKHFKSLWYDESLMPRDLDDNETIFDIIMPWVAEKEEEEKKDREVAKVIKRGPQQQKLAFGKTPVKSKDTTPISLTPTGLLDKEDELRYLSKVIKVGAVEDFKFEFKDKNFLSEKEETRELRDIEAILINPKWADHGYDPMTKQTAKDTERRKAFAGITIEELKKLRIPDFVMRDGILFIWVEKELIFEVIVFFETQGFAYVENLCYVMLDQKEKSSVEALKNTDATPAISRRPYKFLNKSHKTLLMLRRVRHNSVSSFDSKLSRPEKLLSGVPQGDSGPRLELRHQRTGDVVFDWEDDTNPFKTPQYYTYKLIETLLPKAMNKLPKSEITLTEYNKVRKFKMVELWAQDDVPRKGWLKVCSMK